MTSPCQPNQDHPSYNRILLADDDPTIRRLLATWLDLAGFEVREAIDGAEALAFIERDAPDYLITDWEMPRVDGISLCRKLRDMQLPHYTYVVFLTGRSNRNDIIQALNAGADDYLHKPIQRNELLARMRSGGRVLELERRLTALARTDMLTGLLTRRTFMEQLEMEWTRSCRHRSPCSCVMFDIDFFKRVNDQHGHAVGDMCLQTVARLMQRTSRRSDVLCRFAGDEFVALLPETNEQQAATWAEHLRESISETPIYAGDTKLQLSCSFGIAQFHRDLGSPQELIELTDQAMFLAKQLGRDRVTGHEMVQSQAAASARALIQGGVFGKATAGDVMAGMELTLKENASVLQAIEYFRRSPGHPICITDENDQLRGIVLESNLMQVVTRPADWGEPVSRYMTVNAATFEETEPASRVFEFLRRVNIGRVIVTRNGEPQGFVSRSALLCWVTDRESHSVANSSPSK